MLLLLNLKRFFILSLICAFSCDVYSQLLINEVLASNISVNRDPIYNNYGDWIEIYNGGSEDVNLNNFYLSDDANDPTQYQIQGSELIIKSREYKLIWMNGNRVSDGHIYTNFSISGDGEFISLYDDQQTLIDSVSFAEQIGDVSYGRESVGSDRWAYFQTPTPELGNEGLYSTGLNRVSSVEFSMKSGFYESGISVSLSCDDASADIYYTLNGDIPTDTSQLYVSAIVISDTQVIRARAFSDKKLSSPISTSTYFIGVDAQIPIVSISTNRGNFYDDEYGIYVAGTNGQTGRCTSVPVNWNRNWERNLNFEYFDSNGERVINQLVGTKISGGCSRKNRYKSLGLYARSKYGKESMDYDFFPDQPNNSYKAQGKRI